MSRTLSAARETSTELEANVEEVGLKITCEKQKRLFTVRRINSLITGDNNIEIIGNSVYLVVNITGAGPEFRRRISYKACFRWM